ncbi:MAG: methyltransferase [Acidimicrobiia bacterium]|nr:MAG: methyltransferase [Acidimicrobiia bacterium]
MARRAPRAPRVIGGTARGRRLAVPPGTDVRPTKDVVREALFSALDARGRVAGAAVLDCYAGSGALAIEALSRGARVAVLVEQDPRAADAIERNLDALGLRDRARLVRADVLRAIAGAAPAEAPFDLVFVDPPYVTTDADVGALLGAIVGSGWCAPGALVVLERPASAHVGAPPGVGIPWERRFGDTLVAFLERTEDTEGG